MKGLSITHDQLLLGPPQAADSHQPPEKGGQQFIFQTNMILSGTNMETSRIRRQVHGCQLNLYKVVIHKRTMAALHSILRVNFQSLSYIIMNLCSSRRELRLVRNWCVKEKAYWSSKFDVTIRLQSSSFKVENSESLLSRTGGPTSIPGSNNTGSSFVHGCASISNITVELTSTTA